MPPVPFEVWRREAHAGCHAQQVTDVARRIARHTEASICESRQREFKPPLVLDLFDEPIECNHARGEAHSRGDVLPDELPILRLTRRTPRPTGRDARIGNDPPLKLDGLRQRGRVAPPLLQLFASGMGTTSAVLLDELGELSDHFLLSDQLGLELRLPRESGFEVFGE